jgi:hypothetical protein
MSDVAKVLEAAKADAGLVREHGRDNRGWEVEAILASVGLPPGQPWCAAWVYWIGDWALRQRWPLPKTGSCDVLGEYARQQGMLVTQPSEGDVFLLWRPSAAFYHTGFVTKVLVGDVYTTVEGNTSDDGSANGWGVLQRQRRRHDGDRFIRWASYTNNERP